MAILDMISFAARDSRSMSNVLAFTKADINPRPIGVFALNVTK
jgi:hypothetical protein